MTEWSSGEEEMLVAAAQAGDLRAYDALVQHYRPAVTSVARQILRNRELAEDAAQDALITAFKALPQLKDSSRFGAWLASIVRHRSTRLATSNREEAAPLDRIIAAYVPSLTQRDGEVRSELACALEDLPEPVRLVGELFYLDEWDTRQISEFLSLPLTTVKWRLHTARKVLKPRLAAILEN